MNGSTDTRSNNENATSAARKSGADSETETPKEQPSAPSSDRIISGIDLLDFGAGGMLPQKVYLVRGGSGVGKSLLGLQYLTRGLELQEPGVLITDQRPENVLEQAKSIGFAIEESVRRGQLTILNPSQHYFELVESPADVQAIVEELGDLIKRVGARRLVVDPVFSLINTSYSAHFALAITQSMLNALEDLPVTTMLIAPQTDDNAEMNPILRQLEQNAFGVIDLTQDTRTGGRLMQLSKLRYANSENLSAHYRILNGRGLINYKGEGESVSDVTKPWEESAPAARTVLLLGAPPDTIKRVKEVLGSDYQVQAEADLKTGVERAKKERPALVLVTPARSMGSVSAILDLAQNASSSIAFLSPSANRQADKVLYLRAGADDFITEPFTPAEFCARVDALIRRSGRRLNLRDSQMGNITPEEMSALMSSGDATPQRKASVITSNNGKVQFDREFQDRLQRNVETVSKFDQPFALYWIKGKENDPNFNKSLAQLCRQEDVVCHNRGGEFVAILTGVDQNGVKGFESRLSEKMGGAVSGDQVRKGYSLHKPGESTEGFVQRSTDSR
ncbi:MAG: ATPase domain-containing protein [Thermoanaerobaculia bacterium]